MNKFLYRAAADALCLLHLALALLAVFGWLFPDLWVWWMATLVAVLFSDVVFGYCILSKWEFDLRRRISPKINYDFAWATYYTYKITNKRISDVFYGRAAIAFLVACIAINLYFKFVF